MCEKKKKKKTFVCVCLYKVKKWIVYNKNERLGFFVYKKTLMYNKKKKEKEEEWKRVRKLYRENNRKTKKRWLCALLT